MRKLGLMYVFSSGFSLETRNKCLILHTEIGIKADIKMTIHDNFKRYDSPEQYAEAFQQMIDAREKWREQVREQETIIAQ